MLTLTKYNNRDGVGQFVPLTLDECKALRPGNHIWAYTSNDKTVVRVKVNGKPKRWKRDQNRIEIPFKYGLYEYGRFYNRDIEQGRLLREVL